MHKSWKRQETFGWHRRFASKLWTFLRAMERETALSLASAYQNLAIVYTSQGKLKKALDAVSSALTAWNRELPPNHPFLVDALATKIVIYGRLKSLPQAEAIIPETLELSLSRFGPDNPVRAILLSNVAEIYIAERKYREAELCFARPPNYTGGISRTAIPC